MDPKTMEHKIFEAEVKEFDEKDLSVTHFISTERRDRGGDVLLADGLRMDGRPVVLMSHGFGPQGTEPIAKPVWIKRGEFKGRKGIQAKTQFFPDETGKRLWQKTTQGFMPSWSIGWRPLEWEMIKDKESGDDTRLVKLWELLEYSLVAVPMQPDAQTFGLGSDAFCFKMIPESEEKMNGELVAWKKDDETWEEKPFPNEHSCRLTDPKKYTRIRRQNNKFGQGVHAIWGVQGGGKPVELQAIRFSKDKFSPADAKKWVKDHEYKCKLFEAASEKCAECGEEMTYKPFMDDPDEGIYSCGNCKGNGKNRCKCDNEKCGYVANWSKNCDGMKCLKCEGKGTLRTVKPKKQEPRDGPAAPNELNYTCKCQNCGNKIQSTRECKDEVCTKCGGMMRPVKPKKPGKEDDAVEDKGTVVPYRLTQHCADTDEWNLSEELGKATIDDLKEMAVYYNEKKPTLKSSYKGIHHKAANAYPVHSKAVRNLGAKLANTRGGLHMSSGQLGQAREHVAHHYDDLGLGDPPWKKKEMETILIDIAVLDAEGFKKYLTDRFEDFKKVFPGEAEFFKQDADSAPDDGDNWSFDDSGDGDSEGTPTEAPVNEDETIIIKMVDGDAVRDTQFIDFTMGGHHYIYDWIPENEVWIDNRMSDEDIIATKIHELFERNLMKYAGYEYDAAHDGANMVEKITRHLTDGTDENGGPHDGDQHHWFVHHGDHHHTEGYTPGTVDHPWDDGRFGDGVSRMGDQERQKFFEETRKAFEEIARKFGLLNEEPKEDKPGEPAPGPEVKQDDNPPEKPRKVVVIMDDGNGQSEAKEQERQKYADLGKQIGDQLEGLLEKIVRPTIKEELDRYRGKVPDKKPILPKAE